MVRSKKAKAYCLTTAQIDTAKEKLLKITMYYTKGTIMLQGHACRGWVDHEFKCHKFVVNAN